MIPRDAVIQMAWKAGLLPGHHTERLEAFAELVAVYVTEECVREAGYCAENSPVARSIASAIKARKAA